MDENHSDLDRFALQIQIDNIPESRQTIDLMAREKNKCICPLNHNSEVHIQCHVFLTYPLGLLLDKIICKTIGMDLSAPSRTTTVASLTTKQQQTRRRLSG